MGHSNNPKKRRAARRTNRENKKNKKKQQRLVEIELAEGKSEKVRMCTAKRSFPTHNAAIKAALDTSLKYGHAMRPYKCPHCEKWHVTKIIH